MHRLKSLKLRSKMLIILFLIILSLSALSFIVLETSSSTYDSLIYEQSADILNLSVYNIENELNNIEKSSYNILIDTDVQSLLTKINNSKTAYEQHISTTELQEILVQYIQSNKFITSINIIDTHDQVYTAGLSQKNLVYDDIINYSHQKEGQITWSKQDSTNSSLIASRDIRQIANTSLKYLGNLVITIDLNKLLTMSSNKTNVPMSNIAIKSNNQLIYISNENQNDDILNRPLSSEQGYYIDEFYDNKYLVSYNQSDYTGFTYINFIPYDDIFKEVIYIRNHLLISIIIIIIIAVILGTIYTRNITKPLENICLKMKQVEEDNFDYRKLNLEPYDYEDEIGFIYKEFNIMISKINTLITENYIKQLNIKDTKYKMLQAQINPHFLYNTLDSINWMARVNKQHTIAEMVKSLGSIFRKSINNSNLTVTLKEELELIQDYIVIQKIRYEERLIVEVNIDDSLLDFQIPQMSLQPLIENSINYALEQSFDVCKIVVSGNIINNKLNITVSDNGPGMTKEFINRLLQGQIKPKGSGIGIQNIQERLKILYGDEFTLDIISEVNKATHITFKIPIKRQEVI